MLVIIHSTGTYAQQTSISFELNGRTSNVALKNGGDEKSKNPFFKFVGEWTLEGDNWSQNWGQGTEHIKIPNHHTVSREINTDNSLLSIIDGPEPNGHIFWSYNPNTKEVYHLSSFGTIRAGSGKGTIDENGNLTLKLLFEGEPEKTHRIYTYKWLNKDTYELKSVQFNADDEPTGLFYGGTFVRIVDGKSESEKGDKASINSILKVLDDNTASMEAKLSVYSDDVVHMAPENIAITNKADLRTYLEEQNGYGYAEMTHKIIDFETYEDIVVMRGQVTGTFHPRNNGASSLFRTKNMFVFKRQKDGSLKIAKVIYNRSPNEK